MDQHTQAPGEIAQGLRVQLEAALGERQVGRLEHRPGPSRVVDETTKFLVRDQAGAPVAFVLVSPEVDPEIVARGMQLAARCKARLGSVAGRVIFDPLAEGEVGGLSYAAMPYWPPIQEGRLRRRCTEMLLRSGLCDWVASVAAVTAEPVSQEHLQPSFGVPLANLAESELVDGEIRQAARASLQRLESGAWSPRHVLMHGDLWQGNILRAPVSVDGQRLRMRERFFIIDWPGAVLNGFPMFDLVRLLMALRIGPRTRSREVARHCQILGCEPLDAVSYLLAALGQIGMNLGHFLPRDYAQMSSHSFGVVAAAVGVK